MPAVQPLPLKRKTILIAQISPPHEGSYRKKVSTSTHIKCSEVHERIWNASVTAKLGVEYSTPPSPYGTAKLSSYLEAAFSTMSMNKYSATTDYKAEQEEELVIEKADKDSTLSVYQIQITGPGISFITAGASTEPMHDSEEYDITPMWDPFLTSLNVVYGEQYAPQSIPVEGGGSGDINKGFGGDFVYLVATYSTDYDSMITDIRFRLSDDASSGSADLAKGAGGQYRFLDLITHKKDGIKPIRHLRLQESDSALQPAYNRTKDLNEGRGGRFLYLTWD